MQVVEKSKKLAEAFRAAGVPVVYVTVDRNNFLKHLADQPYNMGDKPIPAVASEIAPSAGFQHGDILVTKRHWGAFADTDLEQPLKTRGIDTVVLTGISTNHVGPKSWGLATMETRTVRRLSLGRGGVDDVTVIARARHSDTDGLIPTSLFHTIFISHQGRFVILNPSLPKASR